MAAAEVDVVGDGDGTDDVHVRACVRRLVDGGLQCGDDYLVKMTMMALLLQMLMMSAGPCVDVHVYLHSRVCVNKNENAWTEMR